jgi:hypothetical protein
MWEDSEVAGDIWNGRWRRHDIETILGRHALEIIPHEDLYQGLEWLTELTVRLQRAQQTLYTARGSLIHEKAKEMARVEKHRAKKLKTQTLYRVWKIQYKRRPLRPGVPSERPLCLGPPPIPSFQQIITHQRKWINHPPPIPRANRKQRMVSQRKKLHTSPARQGTQKLLEREDHRSQRLKVCRRRHV